MLVTKIASNIFLLVPTSTTSHLPTSLPPLFVLNVTYSGLVGGGVWHLFINIRHLYIHDLPLKYPREQNLDPRNTQEEKFWTHKIPTRKKLRPTKYSPEKDLNPRNTQEKNFGLTKSRCHSGWRPTRPTMAQNPRNLANLYKLYFAKNCD